jgi:hypothetical protein
MSLSLEQFFHVRVDSFILDGVEVDAVAVVVVSVVVVAGVVVAAAVWPVGSRDREKPREKKRE